MVKRRINLLLIALLAITLAACSSAKSSGTTSASSSSSGSQASANQTQAPGGNPAQSVQGKLAIGTLSLEGSQNAVTAEQAKTLLPLWKAVKSMSSSSTISTDEMNALYDQIQEAMTADQITAIKAVSMKQEDLQALAKKYDVSLTQPQMPQGTPNATAMAKRSSSGSSNNGGNTGGPGGGPGGDPGGGMPPDMGGGTGGSNQSQSSGTKVAPQGTPMAGQGGPRGGGGMNSMFADAVIKLLEGRAGK